MNDLLLSFQISLGFILKLRIFVKQMVGQGRLELPTSRLSVVRSNQLSYKPGFSFGKSVQLLVFRFQLYLVRLKTSYLKLKTPQIAW